MGTDKNIKLHIVTDIKVSKQNWHPTTYNNGFSEPCWWEDW